MPDERADKNSVTGVVMVIGGGIAGMQASLDRSGLHRRL